MDVDEVRLEEGRMEAEFDDITLDGIDEHRALMRQRNPVGDVCMALCGRRRRLDSVFCTTCNDAWGRSGQSVHVWTLEQRQLNQPVVWHSWV